MADPPLIICDHGIRLLCDVSVCKSRCCVRKNIYCICSADDVCNDVGNLPVSLYCAIWESDKDDLKNAALIALGNLWKTLLLFVLLLAAAFAVYIFPPAVFIIPCVYMLLANFILEKIFQKYMSPEDLEAEKERNMEYFNWELWSHKCDYILIYRKVIVYFLIDV